MVELRDRVRAALGPSAGRTAVLQRAPRTSAFASQDPVSHALQLRREETGAGDVFVREAYFPVEHVHGEIALSDALVVDASAWERLCANLSSEGLRDAVFFDIETTGLSGGTGTYVFLVGVGGFEDDGFRLRQYFLADLRGETAMMHAVGRALEASSALVSFNGRTFDLPLVETRLRLQRFRMLDWSRPHLDLLYPARKLYRKRLPSCSLGSLEANVLGLQREEDVSGAMIPGLYFDYLRRGRAMPLRHVFRHNALDVLSLVTLTAHLGGKTGSRAGEDGDAEDWLAIGRWDEAEGRTDEAARLYELAWRAGGDASYGGAAAARLARVLRRAGRWSDAAEVWEQETRSRGSARRMRAFVELAKVLEHRFRDYARARDFTRQALTLADVMALRGSPAAEDIDREGLLHRLARLDGRLRRVDGPGVSGR